MKTLEIIRFELQYRSQRPATYLYFVILLVTAFLFSRLGTKGIVDVSVQVKANAPLMINQLTAIMNLPLLLITSAVMGIAVIRDFDSKMEQLMFTTPITKNQYLTGRFMGSFITMVILSTAIIIGSVAGELFSTRPAAELLPFNLVNYLIPFGLVVLPNIFFLGAIYFAGGAMSRKTAVIYTQGIVLLILISIVDEVVIETAQNLDLATIFDFYTVQLFSLKTSYWSAAEINSQQLPISGAVIINRLIYLALGFLALLYTYQKFNFSPKGRSIKTTAHEK